MLMSRTRRVSTSLLTATALIVATLMPALAGPGQNGQGQNGQGNGNLPPLVIKQQGSFSAGGTVLTQPGTFDPTSSAPVGQTLYGDHTYVEYQIPQNPRKYPLVLWHGGGQSGMCWQSTVDGREGYQSIFLRRDFPVYIIDQ